MKRDTGPAAAIGALLGAVVLIVGVPILLIVLVGNPWPGRTRLELGDEVALVVGVLAVLAWLVWARFVVAVVLEVRLQVAELRLASRRDPGSPVALSAPPEARQGIGALAQRLVAAMLVLLPLSARVAPSTAEAPAPLRSERVATQAVVSADQAPSLPPRPTVADPAPTPAAAGRVTVAPGDTLIGLARTHLGDAARWRELFELNRDRPQVDGQRLTSPSGLRTGWELTLPAATVTVEAGDNLWALTEERLAGAGLPAGDADVAAHLQVVIDLNADVLEDPDLIYVGEQIDFPAIDVPAPPPPVEAASVVAEPTPPPPSPEPVPPPPVPALTVPAEVEVVPTPPTTTPPTTTAVPAPAEPDPIEAERAPSAPSPIGIGEAALLSAGVLALLAARRRWRLRASQPRARVPEPPPGTVATERRLRAIDAGERLLRLDVAVRAASATLVDGDARIAVVRTGVDGAVELTLTGQATLPPPWEGDGGRWTLGGSTPVELLAEAARAVGAPCIALTQLGVDDTGREVFADLEALGLLTIVASDEQADAVVRGIAATLGTSVFADVASLIGVGLDGDAFLDHRRAQHVDAVDEALELATTLVGTTSSARQTTFVLRARHTSGEAWEPAIVLAGSSVAGQLTPDVATAAGRARGGVAMVAASDAPGAPWSLRAGPGRWTLEPLGIALVPVGLSAAELHDLHDVLDLGGAPLLDAEADVDHVAPALAATPGLAAADVGPYEDPPWSLLVRLLGPVDVVDGEDRPVRFERSKALELVAWLTLHRERSTRAGARTALWELDVRDATFANIVSEARRAMARHVEPPPGVEWLGRTLTEILPLDERVVADVELLRARLDHARLQPPDLAIETLQPAVELVRDLPFAGTGYLWPDAEGIASNLVLLATSAATELAGHHLSMGAIDGVFWATGQGLKVLPGHEELIALRMRAHAGAGDLSGVRLEWESYERVLSADPWSDGEPAPKLVLLRRELLSS